MFANIIILSKLVYGFIPGEKKINKLLSGSSVKSLDQQLIELNQESEKKLSESIEKLPNKTYKEDKEKLEVKENLIDEEINLATYNFTEAYNRLINAIEKLREQKEINIKAVEI